jgi:hypothetical protein
LTIHRVTDSAAVDDLAAGLLDAARARPWCVVSTPFDSAVPRFDLDEIERQVGDLCAVFVLPTGELSRRLSAALPDHADAYGGAARSYPPGDGWPTDLRLTRLRWVAIPSQAATMTDRLIGDLFTMAYRSGLVESAAEQASRASGVVKSIVAGTRGMVQLDSGDVATIVHELTFPEVPLEWVISPGQRVTGMFDPASRRLALDSESIAPARLIEWYPDGAVTLALVLSTERQRASLAVHPSVVLVVERDELSGNPRDRADLLLAPGDVVPVRVVRDEQGRVRLRTRDIDDDEPILPAQPVFENGEPWLRSDRVLSTPEDGLEIVTLEDFLASHDALSGSEPDPAPPGAPEPAPVRPGPGPRPAMAQRVPPAPAPASAALKSALGAVDVLKSEVARLRSQVAQLGGLHAREELQSLRQLLGEALRERDAAKLRAAGLDASRRETQALLRQARSDRGPQNDPTGRRARFSRDEDWIRHEIYLAWIDRLDAADRERYPLPDPFDLGPKFAPSLEGMDAGQLQKIFRAVVDVLTGYVRELGSRNVHPLREGTGAGDAGVTRSDGSVCLRAYVEQSTPSARRLHYWQSPSRRIELSRVVLHDDMNP